MTAAELKDIEGRLRLRRKYPSIYGPELDSDIAALLAGYKERDAEVKRLEEENVKLWNKGSERSNDQR